MRPENRCDPAATKPGGMTCLVASGYAFERLNETLPLAGVPG